MNLAMSGTDHTTSGVEERESLSLTPEKQREILEYTKSRHEISGAVLLSTCNRAELYLSLTDGAHVTADDVLRENGIVLPEGHYVCSGKEVYSHLSTLACGAKSRIFGEDQILSQVKGAIALSREYGSADSVLEVLFRTAVTAAKKVKTCVKYSSGEDAAALAVESFIREKSGGKRVLVIGSGEMGRLNAGYLQSRGYNVSMTLRQYRHGKVSIPGGVTAVEYDLRYSAMENADVVISATKSPHYTVTAQALAGVTARPRLFIDLAVPRDIDPEIKRMGGIQLYGIDEIPGGGERRERYEQHMAEIAPVLEEGWREFTGWEKRAVRHKSMKRKTHFPLFVDVTGKTALIVGGGKIAARRAQTLSLFAFDIAVVSPEITPELQALVECGRVRHICRSFEDADLDDVFLAVAATNDRQVNRRVGILARHRGIYVSVADKRGECSVFFPAVVDAGDITAGVCGNGTSHHAVAAAAKKVREVLE